MSRPPLSLSDDAARSLVLQLGPIQERHAHDTRQHRPFVRDFVRAVYHATGATFSAAYYRKLMKAYAPDRAPSTPTIETEKNRLVAELRGHILAPTGEGSSGACPDAGAGDGAPTPGQPAIVAGTDLVLREMLGLQQHTIGLINGMAAAPRGGQAAPGQQAHVDYLGHRLAAAESELAAARGLAARLAAELREQQALASERAGQVAALQAAQEAQVTALAAMAAETQGNRQFMAQAVDAARGEVRTARERCAQLELQLKDKEREADMYRQRALAGVPASAAVLHGGTAR